jgi:hypothetical protein
MIAGGRRQFGGTPYHMHSTDLCIKHALGMVVQKRRSVVVASFPPGKHLKARKHNFLSTVKNKEQKQE